MSEVFLGLGSNLGDRAGLLERAVAALPIDYPHVFTFSPRPGTAAAAMPGRPPAPEVKRRVRALRALGEEKRAQFHCAMAGRTFVAIVERRRPGGLAGHD